MENMSVELPGGRTKTLDELIRGWNRHVQRLWDEHDADLRSGSDVWGAHDYIAALYIRDFVAKGLAEAALAVNSIAEPLVRAADDQLRAFTEEDADGLVLRFAHHYVDPSAWWWSRIPRSGPVRQELMPEVDRS